MNSFIKLLFISNFLKYSNGDIMPPIDNSFGHNCLISAGYSWCDGSESCIRRWETPCTDNYIDCNDCFKKQQHGENIACPEECDNINTLPVHIPINCNQWYDGCNNCNVKNGILTDCTRLMCFIEDTPYCINYLGH